MGQRIVFSTIRCQKNWIFTCNRIKLDPYLIPSTKINSQWIKDITERAKTIKLVEESTGINLGDLELGNGFLGMTSKAQATKEKKTDKWNSIRIVIFVFKGEKKVKRKPTNWQKIL